MSVIHYKFKSAKNYDSVTFEGLSFPLFNLKREILIAQKLRGTDSDIIISNAQTNEDYLDDSMLIPKNTSVYVRRVPAKPGGTNAMYYISDDPQNALQAKTGEVHADLSSYGNKGNNYNDEDDNNPAFGDITLSMDGVIPGENEEEKLQALFDQTSTQWRQQNAHMGGHQGSYRGSQNYSAQRNQNQFNKPISANYVCHKCGIKGHYVQNCPSQVDRKNMQPRVKKTTGIPRSFLKNVEQVPDGKGAMVASDGTLVIAQANSTAWEKIRMNQRASGFSFEELRETAPIVNELQCKVCQKLLVNAVSVPCCRTLFCLDCITEALINPDPEKHFKCPSCNKVGIVPDNLIAEHSVRADVGEHLRKWAKDRLGDNESEHEMDKPNPIPEESNDIQDDIQPHTEHNPRQIITVADSRDNHIDYSNRSNDYSNRNNDYSSRNNDYSNRNNDYNSRNNDYNPRNRNQQREDDLKSGDGRFNENASNTIELPPLHWTPDNGITGHITIPPMEKLVGTDFYDQNFGKHNKSRNDYNNSGNQGRKNFQADRRTGCSRERDNRRGRSSHSNRSRSRSERGNHNRRDSPSPRRGHEGNTSSRRSRGRSRSRDKRSRRSRSRSVRKSRSRSPANHRGRNRRSPSRDRRNNYRDDRDKDRRRGRDRSRSRSNTRNSSRRDTSRRRDNKSSRNLSHDRHDTQSNKNSRPSITSRLGPTNM